MTSKRAMGAAWERRHPWIAALVAAQAILLAVLGTVDGHIAASWAVVPVATALIPAVAGNVATHRQQLLATSTAVALAVQAAYAIFAFDGEARGFLLMLGVLCVVALYESGVVLAATYVVLALGLGGITVADPTVLGFPEGETNQMIETIVISYFVSGVAACVIATMWRDHRRMRHIAGQQARATTAYLEVAGSLMIVLDRDGIVTEANRQTCLTLDREADDIIGQEWFGLALPEEYRDEARRLYLEGYEAWKAVGQVSYEPYDYENEVECRDGSRRVVSWWATMITNRRGEPIGMVCSGTDLTNQRASTAALERSKLELDSLRRLAQKVASLDDSRQAVVDAALPLTGATAVAILEPNRTGTHLIVSTATEEHFLGESIELGREHAIAASAFLSGQPHFIRDCDSEPGVNQRMVEAYGVRSLTHQPILGGAGPLGVLTVTWDEQVDSSQERKVELVGLIAHEASIALRRRESLLQLERAALVDPLSGVANRRAFDAELPLALRRAGTGNYPLGLISMDLNEFKAVNDVLGHEAGDDVLIRCASAWADALRAGDLLTRIGGDEFAVILPACDEVEMELIINRLKRATPHGPGSSMGGATWDGSESVMSLIRRADHAQYADKAAMKRTASNASEMDDTQTDEALPEAGVRVARPRGDDPRGDGL